MKLAALVSGGKDSLYAAYLASKDNEITKVVSVISKNNASYMFHSVNIQLVEMQAKSMGKDFVSIVTEGEKEYELGDLETVLKDLDVEGVVCGAIASEYQRSRVQAICDKLGLKLLSPLWGIEPEQYMHELIERGFKVIIVGVAAEGLGKEWLGREINNESLNALIALTRTYQIHLAGEGGEYETLVLDCPLFNKKIQIADSIVQWDPKSKSGFFIVKKAEL
jgi:diphthine-ammonia ligase